MKPLSVGFHENPFFGFLSHMWLDACTHTHEYMAKIRIIFLQFSVMNALKEAILETKP
jgi:hypothetical protein